MVLMLVSPIKTYHPTNILLIDLTPSEICNHDPTTWCQHHLLWTWHATVAKSTTDWALEELAHTYDLNYNRSITGHGMNLRENMNSTKMNVKSVSTYNIDVDHEPMNRREASMLFGVCEPCLSHCPPLFQTLFYSLPSLGLWKIHPWLINSGEVQAYMMTSSSEEVAWKRRTHKAHGMLFSPGKIQCLTNSL